MKISLVTPADGPTWLPVFARSIVDWLYRLAGRTGTTGSVSATTTLTSEDGSVFVNAAGGARTINLPPAANVPGRIYTVKKVDASGNTVTIDPNGAETIDGAGTVSLTSQYQSRTIQSDGVTWWVI